MVSAIPKGYHNVIPYIIVNNAAQAIEFYKKAFGAKEVMRFDRPDGKVGHAEIKIGDTIIMLADESPEMQALAPKAYGGSPVSLLLYIEDVDAVFKKAISLGATEKRPLENMFYGDRTGSLIDPFGHIWYVSTHIEDVSQEEVRKRVAGMYSKK